MAPGYDWLVCFAAPAATLVTLLPSMARHYIAALLVKPLQSMARRYIAALLVKPLPSMARHYRLVLRLQMAGDARFCPLPLPQARGGLGRGAVRR